MAGKKNLYETLDDFDDDWPDVVYNMYYVIDDLKRGFGDSEEPKHEQIEALFKAIPKPTYEVIEEFVKQLAPSFLMSDEAPMVVEALHHMGAEIRALCAQ